MLTPNKKEFENFVVLSNNGDSDSWRERPQTDESCEIEPATELITNEPFGVTEAQIRIPLSKSFDDVVSFLLAPSANENSVFS